MSFNSIIMNYCKNFTFIRFILEPLLSGIFLATFLYISWFIRLFFISRFYSLFTGWCITTSSAAGSQHEGSSENSLSRSAGVTTAPNDECATERLQACMTKLQAINQDHNLAFASTERELDQMCK